MDGLFDNLKRDIYSMYIAICKCRFVNECLEIEESDIDTLLAKVCVAYFDLEITYDEFRELSGYLVQTYALYKMKGA